MNRMVSSDFVIRHTLIFGGVLFIEEFVGYDVLEWREVWVGLDCVLFCILIEA